MCSHTLTSLYPRAHTLPTLVHPSSTRLHSRVLTCTSTSWLHSHSGGKGPSSHLCPAPLPTRWLWDRVLIPAGSRRHVARCAGCSPVCLWLPLVTLTRPHTELRQAIKSRLWGLSGASLVTSGRWLSLPPCPSLPLPHHVSPALPGSFW